MVNQTTLENKENKIAELLGVLESATSLTKLEKAKKLMGQIDLVADSLAGVQLVFQKIGIMTKAGIFKNSPWEDPSKLVAGLVNGTLKSGHPNSTIELLSELRILAAAKGELTLKGMSQEEASDFIQEVIVSNLEFVFQEPMEDTRLVMNEHELNKVHSLFCLLTENTGLDNVKEKLAEELVLICEQRPVVTEKQRKIIALIKEKIELDPQNPEDIPLLEFQRSIYSPTKHCYGIDFTAYQKVLEGLNPDELEEEAKQMGHSMAKFGLVSDFHAVQLLYLIKKKKFSLVPNCLALDKVGEAKWSEGMDFVSRIILETVRPFNAQCIYGIARMIELGIFSRDAVRSGLSNLMSVKIHPEVEERILKSIRRPAKGLTAKQYLIGGLLRILGQPLGVGQGSNPTCQSARGISMWSQHAPAKLIHMVHTAAVYNDLAFRFQDEEVRFSETGKGLVDVLDYNLDAVSVTLVPMLDRIYNEMMIRASGRGEDPHKWVNPALYGQWIPIGFASAYDYLSNAIFDFDGFVRIFYAMGHPKYNGGHRLVYPNPVGIFITSSKGERLGFHAVSLLRVDKDPNGVYRAYFLNPNNEGRQNWGQNIQPSVYGHGEKHGESSLPYCQFAARVYAFHFNRLEALDKMEYVPNQEVQRVKKLAKESWGKSYAWIETKKKW